jgi:hypothetical protein
VGVAVYVKRSATLVALVPPPVVTVISTVGGSVPCAGLLTVIRLSLGPKKQVAGAGAAAAAAAAAGVGLVVNRGGRFAAVFRTCGTDGARTVAKVGVVAAIRPGDAL